MKAGSWGSIWLVYLYSVLCAASISKLIPIERDIERALGTTPEGIGIAISLVSVCSAFAATIGGGIIDLIGARLAIISASLVVIVADVISFFAKTMFVLDLARVIEGFEFIGIMVAAPALIMATTTGKRQVHAMSLWSTYIPAGFGIGLLLAVPFVGTPAWRWTFVVHGALFAAAVLLGGLLPVIPREANAAKPVSQRSRLAELLSVYGEMGPMRLSISNALLVSVGLGTSTVIPRYFAQTHHVSMATSSTISAFTNLAMIAGGIGAGVALSRGMRTISLYGGIAVMGVIVGTLLYAPWVAFPAAVTMLVLWAFTTGVATAALMALLPRVVKDPSRGGAASGLVGQVMAVTNFVTPAIYYHTLSNGSWLYFVALVVVCWLGSLAFLPAWKMQPAAASS
ncbi:MAG: MFS transporter [Acidobacteriia bacterium]|nr:MFS transporter [Terriglobia bacterium]